MRVAARRVRVDLTAESRLVEYAGLLSRAGRDGYDLVALHDFWRTAQADHRLTLVIRHDVDINDPAGNRRFHEVESAAGARATYYFRLSTAPSHELLIRDLLRDGFEVGYHFEEVATVAKRHGLIDRDAVVRRRQEIVDLFRANCELFRSRWNPELRSVAAHGDWMNRRLGVINNEFIDHAVLSESGLDFEAYQPTLIGRMDVYVSDVASPPARWTRDYGLADALGDGRSPIYLLTHERQWHGSPRAAIGADVDRAVDELRYRLRVRRTAGRLRDS